MLVTNRSTSRFGLYEGFSTHLLMGESNTDSTEISIQMTDVEPDGMQFIHSHEQAQCYYILAGCGEMIIDEQTKAVAKGDAIYIPPHATHGIKNIGKSKLTYLTANPAFGRIREHQLWPESHSV